MGAQGLAPYQAAYAVGSLAPTATTAITNHWLPGLMQGQARSRRDHLLSAATLGIAGTTLAGPALVLFLPATYDAVSLWPIAAIAGLSAIPQAFYLQAQARATFFGATRTIGITALIGTVTAMMATLALAVSIGSYVAIALVTPSAYAFLAVALRWRTSRAA